MSNDINSLVNIDYIGTLNTPNLEALSFKLINIYYFKNRLLKECNITPDFSILTDLHCCFWGEETFSLIFLSKLIFEVNFGFL